MYFNIEIGILDKYIVECEVHWLVFIIQWIEKMHGETLKYYYCIWLIILLKMGIIWNSEYNY